MQLELAPDVAALAAQAARWVAEAARGAVARTGRFCVAVSGGATPTAMFAALAGHDLPWEQVHIFQVDERVVPDGDPARNLVALGAELLDRVPARPHLMDVTAVDPGAAAAAYAAELAALCGGALDLVHLGLGDDGHTASWPPGDPVVGAATDVALVGPYAGYRRLTLTPRAINRATSIMFLVSGSAKRGALAGLRRADPALPASRVRGDAVIFADLAAAGPIR